MTATERTSWSFFKRLGFRFSFLYLMLYTFPFPLTTIPGVNWIFGIYNKAYSALVQWFGQVILNVGPISEQATGSGDKLFDWVFVFTCILLAICGSLIWSVVDRKRENYNWLWKFFFVWLRYYLACFLVIYGLSKVFLLQFSDLSLFDLVKTYGESSPMALVWNFMEFSDSYTIFSGLGELIAGLLLFYRRTVILGCIIAIAVMATVVMLNFSYDVPVKLFSSHLLFIAFFLLIPSYERLFNLLLFNRPTTAVTYVAYFKDDSLRITGVILKILFLALFFTMQLSSSTSRMSTYGKKAPKPLLYGIYSPELFVRNGDSLPANLENTYRWRYLIVGKRSVGIKTLQDSMYYYSNYTANDTLKLTGDKNGSGNYEFTFRRLEDTLWLEGFMHKDTLLIRLKRIDHEQMLLKRRGFNWVNEVPYNR